MKTNFKKVFDEALEKTDKDIYDACQIFEYQVNSLSAQSQTPFSTITFNIPTSWESERIILNYLKVRQAGLGTKATTIFPKISYIVVDGYNLKEEDKYYYITKEVAKTMLQCTYPDLLFYSKEDYDNGRYYGRMGCRSRVNHDFKKDGKYLHYSRFNWGVQTLNGVNLTLQCINENKWSDLSVEERTQKVLSKIEEYTPYMEESILWRYNCVKNLKPENAPILFMNGGLARLGAKDSIESLLRSTQSSVSYGYIGIADCVRLITDNKYDLNSKIGKDIGLQLAKKYYEECNKIKEKTGLPVSLYSTPAESGIYTYYVTDLENYGHIMPQWLKDRGYYTNSYHFSSEKPIDAFEKIEIESEFVKFANGGNIVYTEVGSGLHNYKTVIELMQHAYKCGVEYYGINNSNNKCFECGYVGKIEYNEEKETYICPECGNTDGRKMSIVSRCCGYLSNYSVSRAVKGRLKEISNRAKHI